MRAFDRVPIHYCVSTSVCVARNRQLSLNSTGAVFRNFLVANVARKSDVLLGCYDEVTDLSGVSLSCYDQVNDKQRTCYEEVAMKLLRWNLVFTENDGRRRSVDGGRSTRRK